ncbi:hypothetical protein ABZ819_05100 [Streptomyces venezuelae]|uniref:hypothetical protein n=1 Tax=Streptomyces venezuelae TaxID=54571 RepID=UPI0034225A83
MDITTTTRDEGVYILRTIGTLQWPEGDQTWRAPGVRLDLMDGPDLLARCKLEVAARDAETRSEAVITGIEPWVKTLRCLDVVRDLRQQLEAVTSLMAGIHEEGPLLAAERADEMVSLSGPDEVEAARASGEHEPLGLPLGALVSARLRTQISRGLRLSLAYAPSPAETPIHPAWERPSLWAGKPGESLVQDVARELLAAWSDVRDARDPLITWAVRDAGVERTTVQQITSVARTTINRLLPS